MNSLEDSLLDRMPLLRKRRSGTLGFVLKCIVAVALVSGAILAFRVFFYSPYRVTGNSMAETLLPGDRVFCNRWIYGPGVFGARLFGIGSPQAGDVVLFTLPGTGKTAVRRCVALSGQELELVDKELYVDGVKYRLPATATRPASPALPADLSVRDELPRVRIPQAGDVVDMTRASGSEFDYLVSLIRQEHPAARISTRAHLFVNNVEQDRFPLGNFALASGTFGSLPFDSLTWIDYARLAAFLRQEQPERSIRIERELFVDGERLEKYSVESNSVFVLSDNWDAYSDSRVYGFISVKNVLGIASMVSISLDPLKPWYNPFTALRWSRTGCLVR